MNLKEEASATMKHDDTPCSGDTREGWAWWKKRRAVSVAVLVLMNAFIVTAIMPKAGYAAASPCAIELHKQALSLAIDRECYPPAAPLLLRARQPLFGESDGIVGWGPMSGITSRQFSW